MREVTALLNTLFDGVMNGSEKLYDGLPALSLDGQALAVAITAHGPSCAAGDSFASGAPPRSLCCGRLMHGAGDWRAARKD